MPQDTDLTPRFRNILINCI